MIRCGLAGRGKLRVRLSRRTVARARRPTSMRPRPRAAARKTARSQRPEEAPARRPDATARVRPGRSRPSKARTARTERLNSTDVRTRIVPISGVSKFMSSRAIAARRPRHYVRRPRFGPHSSMESEAQSRPFGMITAATWRMLTLEECRLRLVLNSDSERRSGFRGRRRGGGLREC